MSKRERELYRAGLVDAVQERPSLAPVLAIADQKKLLIAYGKGVVAGHKLTDDENDE